MATSPGWRAGYELRGRTVCARVVDAYVRWRGLKHRRDELRKWESHEKIAPVD